ncbi:MAG: ferredoxin family protein [Terracidiphilus sp.]|jgi:ferredoxin--NADP+ reductase
MTSVPDYSVITDRCIKDLLCIEACPNGAIHPTPDEPHFASVTQLYIDPEVCTNCGACYVACECNAVFAINDLPEEFLELADVNAEYFRN